MVNTGKINFLGERGKCFESINESKTVEKVDLIVVWKRCVAYMFDIFIVNLFAFLVLIASTLIIGPSLEIYGIAFANLALFAYFVYFESSAGQATPGKKWMDLKVMDFEGRRISFVRAFFRYFARGMPAFVLVVVDVTANGVGIVNEHLLWYFFMPFVTYIPILFMDEGKGVHDVLAGTVVREGSAGNKE
ncbi:RDD domain containing protein [Methanosarcina lacustris Z-7289]|uniref:RDD domain containing protein n=1 Tax=Methanosarcina lacustris Z-7289 TaxID=1434111 RepID=A0A0E3S444_9EURY|nr:RDD family protein [Methanosarcina lacustris]AKB75001.1 RDD domain containing protein [Methanosarcina lacustris Z-7289]